MLVDEGQELALAHYGICEVEAIEFVLTRTVVVEILALFEQVDEVIVERTMGHELECADGVGDALEVIALSVGEVVHRVDSPLAAGAVMRLVDDAVDHRVAEVHVRIGHVDLCPEHHGALGHFAVVHLVEQLEALLCWAIAIGAGRAGLCGCAFLLGYLLAGLLVDVGLALLDEPHSKVPELLEIVGRIIYMSPFEAKPFYVALDALHILGILLLGIGIIEAEIADTSETLGDTEILADSLGMADVQIAVGLGREARLHPSVVLTLGQIIGHDLLYKVKIFLVLCFLIIITHN